MSNSKTVRIPSKLYYDLFKTGEEDARTNISGDKLIAVYSILKSSRGRKEQYTHFKSKNNKTVSGYSLLRKHTNLSLSVLKKYVPLLVEKGLCFIDSKGNFVLLGGEKTKEMYSSYKLVPIKIGKNLTDTQYNSFLVRLHSNQKSQEREIKRKKHLSELLRQSEDPINNKRYKKALRLIKKGYKLQEITDQTVLSNYGYSNLKGGNSTKSRGSYLKGRLLADGKIKSRRRFKLLQRMPYNDYIKLKKYHGLSGMYTYIRGHMAMELVASIDVSSSVTPSPVEIPAEQKQPTLKRKPIKPSIDFLAWWDEQDNTLD